MTAARQQRALYQLDDGALIALVRGGDRHALGELYRRHAPAARRAARAFTGSAHDADDVVSDAFAGIWSAIRNGNGPHDRFEPYMITAVKHRARAAWKNGAPAVADAEALTATEGSPAADVEATHDLATTAFRFLSPREREMLWLTAVEGRSSVQAGAEMSLTKRAAATLKFRATRSFAEAYLSAYAAAVARPECKELTPKLSSFVRGSCRPRARRHVEQHLAICQDCHQLTSRLSDVNETLRSIPQPIMAALAAQPKSAWTFEAAAAVRRGWLKPVIFSAAAGAVTLIPAAALFGTDPDVPEPEAVILDVEPPEPGVDGFEKRQRVRMRPAELDQQPAALAADSPADPPADDQSVEPVAPAESPSAPPVAGEGDTPGGSQPGGAGAAPPAPAAGGDGAAPAADPPQAAPATAPPATTAPSVATTAPPANTQPGSTAPATTAPDTPLIQLEVTIPPVIEAATGVDAELSEGDAGVELEVDATVPLLGTEIGVNLDLDLTGGDDDGDDEEDDPLLELDLLD